MSRIDSVTSHALTLLSCCLGLQTALPPSRYASHAKGDSCSLQCCSQVCKHFALYTNNKMNDEGLWVCVYPYKQSPYHSNSVFSESVILSLLREGP